ncbi:hypothetical protein PV326_006824 [Microctonus aethiopoides]|nr:hypothetical protein PV326_006824 [Microctonus aethiopoides]
MLGNIKMISCVHFLVILAVISSVPSEEVTDDTTPETISSELSSIFDVEKKDEIPLETKKNVVCDTKECQIIANEFIRGMNKSIAPCDNFYDFVCGAWETENQIPDYEPMWSRFHIFQDTVNRRIKGILETEPLTTDILPVRQAKKWYRSCLDVEALEKRGILPMEAILLQVGGWPMTLDPEEWDENEHSWQSVEHDYFHITGSHVFYYISVPYGDEFLEKGSIPLRRKLPQKYRNYTGNDYEIYVGIIAEVTELFATHNKASITIEMIEKDAQDLVEFEKELYLLADSIEEYDYGNWTLSEFVQWYNQNITDIESDDKVEKIDFANLIRRKFDLVNRAIDDSDILVVDTHNYYVQMTKLLNRTSTRTIVNYIHWHFVSDMLVYTTELMRDAFFELMRNEYDVKKRPPRWLECIEEMKMTTAGAYAFVQEYYSQEVEDAAKEMIANVREEMAKQIGLSNWMDDETKTLAKEKLNAMSIYIGFPDWYKNETSVLNSYKGLTIGYDHFDNILSFKRYEIKKSLRRTEDMSDMISQSIDPTTVNAFYDMSDNSVVLPAADFQPPLFTSRVPPSVNYGILGLAVGHEIGHGFDEDAFKFGDFYNETKISKEMQELYNERAECFVEQFNKYFEVTEDPDSGGWSRGRLTRPDNVADSTGLHSVFKAFKKLIETHSVENYKLPGFEHYTDDQMFYISFAGMWCESVTPKFGEKRAKFDGHSPGRWRVIGSISNTNDFAEAFNCPVGSPMNPAKKCNIWQSPLDEVASENSKEIKRRRRLGWVRKSILVLGMIRLAQLENTEPVVIPEATNSELSLIFDLEGDNGSPLEEKKNVVCDTKESKELIRGMNKSVAPCDNLYDFVCGAWENENQIPKHSPIWNILETEPLTTDILPVRQAKKWYRSCLDVGALDKRGILPMEAILLQVGGWPMTLDPEEWDENVHSWQSVEHDYFHITGGHVFYDVSLAYTEMFGVSLKKGSIPLYRKLPQKFRNYTGDDYGTYSELITKVTQMFADHNKASITNEMIKKDVQDLVKFEKELYLLADSNDGYEYNEWTLAEFVEWYNENVTDLEGDEKIQKIPFAALIRRKFDLVNREIEDTDVIIVDSNNYYVQLTKLLNDTPKRTIVNYIHWHFVSDMLIYTTETMRDAFFELVKNEFDVKERPPRWLECIEEMKMTTAAAYAFVQKYFSKEVEAAAREMIENVRDEMAKSIAESNWMDEETKTIAKNKLDGMNILVGFPDWYKNETSVLNSYKGLTIGYDHFDNVLSFKKYEIKKSIRYSKEMRGDMDILFSILDPTVVNAMYDPWGNNIVLPAADFQPPLFTSRVPPYVNTAVCSLTLNFEMYNEISSGFRSVNYGIIGLAVGHEIGHGFDADTFMYGLHINETELSDEMQEIYEEQSECFVDQFNRYFGVNEDPDSHRPTRGELTRPDNVADSTGIHSVFRAFKKLIETHSAENYKLPGFENYTDAQMFYISFAGVYCEAATLKYKELRDKYSGHSPGRWRVIGSISNTNDFAEAFNCPVGSPMNPEKKCNIWQSPLGGAASRNLKGIKRRRRLGWVRNIIILAIISFTRSEDSEPSTTPDTIISELSSIFEIEENDKTSLEDKKNVVCDTKECHIIAKELIRGMNMSVSPCDNFYDFVCGAWETENRIPDYEAAWSVLETEPLSTDILPVRQAKKWYRSCLDVGTLEERGIHPMEAVLIQVGGWPMALDPEEWDEKEHSWQSVEHDYFHITGDYVFYGVSAVYWGDWFAIMLTKGSVPLHKKFPEKYRNYTGGDDDSYTQLITVVAQMFADYNKASITSEMIEKDVRDLVEFEKELHLLVDDNKGYDFGNGTVSEFVEWYDANVTDSDTDNEIQKIDFANLIRRKFDLVNRKIEDSDILYIESYGYHVQLTKLLDRTATRTIGDVNMNFC